MSNSSTWSIFPKPKHPPESLPSHHNPTGGGFHNPWPSASPPSWSSLLKSSFPLSIYPNLQKKHPSVQDVQVITPDWGVSDLKKRGLKRENCIIATTLGHAGAITELPLEGMKGGDGKKESFWCVFDPIFSMRAGPTQYTGPGRMRKSPCQVEDLPGCNAILISHNHYDHLDLPTIQALFTRFPSAKYFVPLGNKAWFLALGIPSDLIIELDWWDQRDYSLKDFGFEKAELKSNSHDQDQDQDQDHEKEDERETVLRFTCIPAQHTSGRGALDQEETLWSGWTIEQLLLPSPSPSQPKPKPTTAPQVKGTIYHSGDTGYRPSSHSPHTNPIFPLLSPTHPSSPPLSQIDISFLPIWRGGTLSFLSTLGLRLQHTAIPSTYHGSPADAISIHLDIRSRNSVGVHFGTFVGSGNESLDAVLEFEEARVKAGVGKLSGDGEGEGDGKEDGEGGEIENGKGRAGVLDIGGSIAVEIKARDVSEKVDVDVDIKTSSK
ncbi:hypothetical protein VTL71DRAFT_10080 [Oculimacula yallundae]|uniref:Metallo-beta-lactamase domain-containing protein n=1 Tax=Oculimacula yallundae TaxID=86028 RepID=A0ABR4BQG4_9HELO